jgi:hypothetical protein
VRVLVTGATGFIGKALCDSLRGGHAVVALSRDPDRARRSVPSLSQAFEWNLMREPAPQQAFDGVDSIVHLAGERVVGLWTAAKRQEIVQSRVVGVRNLLQGAAALAERPKQLIGASAVGYYGDRGEETLDETSAPGQGFLCDTCLAWETETRRAEDLGLRVTSLRIGVVLESAPCCSPSSWALGGPSATAGSGGRGFTATTSSV